jgi:hypothetical protein
MEASAQLCSLSIPPPKGTKSSTRRCASCIHFVSGRNHGYECCLTICPQTRLNLHYTTAKSLSFIYVVDLNTHQHCWLNAIFLKSLQSVITTKVVAHINDVGSRLARYLGKICNFYLMQYTVFVECKITKEW